MAKIDRLIGILTILLQQKRVTSPYLADRFEVSRRTIQRDIEVLCQAGIPVATAQGTGGGIEIMDGFTLEKNVFTYDEMQTILDALAGVDSISDQSYTNRFMEKLTTGANVPNCQSTMYIDLSTYKKEDLTDKIKIFREAISLCKRVEIEYLTHAGQTRRCIEPVLLLYRWNSWYIYAFCKLRDDYRLFKLSRIQEVLNIEESFDSHNIDAQTIDWDLCFSPEIELIAVFDASAYCRVVEEFGYEYLKPLSDGTYRFSFNFTFEDYLVQWLLSFGHSVKVLAPEHIVDRLMNEAKNILDIYDKHDNKLSH